MLPGFVEEFPAVFIMWIVARRRDQRRLQLGDCLPHLAGCPVGWTLASGDEIRVADGTYYPDEGSRADQ